MKKVLSFAMVLILSLCLFGCKRDETYVIMCGDGGGEDVTDPSNQESIEELTEDAWGITLSVENVTPTGLTLVCTQSGGNVEGELMTGMPYFLYEKTEEGFKKVSYAIVEPVAWTTQGIGIPKDKTVKWEIDWEYIYGELPSGTYKIEKWIADSVVAKDYEEKAYSVIFEIENPSDENLNSKKEFVKDMNTKVLDFSVRLFSESASENGNTLISPFSLLTALGMTANGANGQTLAEMESVLGMKREDLNVFISDYMENLPTDEKYKLSLANSVWVNNIFDVNKDFVDVCRDYYKSDVYKEPFDTSTLNKLNKWVEDNTDGMIKEILDRISEYSVMYIVNALAFDAEWEEIYEENQIKRGIFTKENSEEQEVEFMYSDEYSYIEDENTIGFIKSYEDGNYAFVALLPDENLTLIEYISTLNVQKVSDLLSNAQNKNVKTSIPKFECEYEVEMSSILGNMEVAEAFDESRADFTNIGKSDKGNIFIHRVIHKTKIKLDEKGTKAGAATVVEIKYGAAIPTEAPKEVYLDRPFVYMIIERKNNIPLFIGTLTEIEQ